MLPAVEVGAVVSLLGSVMGSPLRGAHQDTLDLRPEARTPMGAWLAGRTSAYVACAVAATLAGFARRDL